MHYSDDVSHWALMVPPPPIKLTPLQAQPWHFRILIPKSYHVQDGKKVDALEGADAPALSAKLAQHFKAPAAALVAPPAAGAAAGEVAEDASARARRLLKSRPVMLFMKGSPDAPKCGFSAKVGLSWVLFWVLQCLRFRVSGWVAVCGNLSLFRSWLPTKSSAWSCGR